MWIYVLTYLFCFLIDLVPSIKKNYWIRNGFMLWLYAFFCFGYMVGSDWRNYELYYQYPEAVGEWHRKLSIGFYFMIDKCRFLCPDFFLFIGILKIIYFHSVQCVLKKMTNYFFIALALSMDMFLLFMLIDNPLRFMIAFIFLMYATGALLDNNIKKFVLISLPAILFHFSALPIIIFVLIGYWLRNKIIHVSNRILILIYFITIIISMNLTTYSNIFHIVAENIPILEKKTTTYAVENISPFFTVGSFLNMVYFFLILNYRKCIIQMNFYGNLIFSFSVIYFLLFRIVLIIPTGFRFTIYYSVFYVIALICVYLRLRQLVLKIVFCLIFLVLFSKSLWQGYQFIPYSNSIMYIIDGEHLPYDYRSSYNLKEYFKRMGKYPDR